MCYRLASSLTHYNEEADEYCCQGTHAEFERSAFLHQLAVLPPEALGAEAPVSRFTVHARAAVAAWKVETLVLVYATFAVR